MAALGAAVGGTGDPMPAGGAVAFAELPDIQGVFEVHHGSGGALLPTKGFDKKMLFADTPFVLVIWTVSRMVYMRKRVKTKKMALAVAGLFLSCSAWAMDIVTLATGDMKTGNLQRYADGVFVLDASSGKIRLGTNEVQRVTFSSDSEGVVTLTNGHTGTLHLFSYGDGSFTFQKGSVDKGTVSCQRVKSIEFRSIGADQSSSSGTTVAYGNTGANAGWGQGSHSGTSGSYGGTGYGHMGGRTSYSYSPSGGTGGPVWVDGYYRADGTWVEGLWRDAPGTATYSSSSRSSSGRVWVPGYRRADGTWVEGYWRDAGSSGTGSSTYSRPSSTSYSGSSYRGGSVYVKGYYRKDGTYVHGHTRKK